MFLDLREARCVVVGGGSVAARKARALLEAGATVIVVSPRLSPAIEALSGRWPALGLRCKRFEPQDLEGAFLVISATDDPAVNEAAAREARARGVPVNVADRPGLCSFIAPATVSRGRLQVAVSTGGASPAFARRLREQLEAQLSPRLAGFFEAMAEARALVLERVRDAERRARIFEQLAADSFLGRYLSAEPAAADEMFLARTRELIAEAGGAG